MPEEDDFQATGCLPFILIGIFGGVLFGLAVIWIKSKINF